MCPAYTPDGSPLARKALAAARALVDLLLPPACVACAHLLHAGDSGPICGTCWARLRPLPAPHCDRCGHPRDSYECQYCLALPAWVRAVRSSCWMHGTVARQVVHALKYGGWTQVAEGMALRMARLTWPLDVFEERTAVVAVPLARARLRERGYNQSALLATQLAAAWKLPDWSMMVERTRKTSSQTQLTPEARRRNVSGAFRSTEAARGRLDGAHCILVDDVLTTGATAIACGEALRQGGARIVSLVTFGRAPAIGDSAKLWSDTQKWHFA